MSPFQERVVTEKTELDDKLTRLRPFLQGDVFRGLPADEQDRLTRQERVMTEYSGILADRIAAFRDAG